MNNKKAIIYQKEKNPMQTGIKGDTGTWVLEYESTKDKYNLDFLNFVGTTDSLSQIQIKFISKKEAILYAKENNIEYDLISTNPKTKQKPKSYAENFSFKKVKYY